MEAERVTATECRESVAAWAAQFDLIIDAMLLREYPLYLIRDIYNA
jgi:hypothetical protein